MSSDETMSWDSIKIAGLEARIKLLETEIERLEQILETVCDLAHQVDPNAYRY